MALVAELHSHFPVLVVSMTEQNHIMYYPASEHPLIPSVGAGFGWAPASLSLPRLVVVVGQNGAGKSTLMRGVVSAVCASGFGPVENINYRGDQDGSETAAEIREALADPGIQVIKIEGVDWGLHMIAQYELMRDIMAALEARPELWVVCTCYSPFALERVPAESVFVVARAPDGVRHAKPLTACPDFARWSKGLTTGEVWATVGENWVFALPPETENNDKGEVQ